MTSSARPEVGRWGPARAAGGPTWMRIVVIVAVLVLAFVVAQTCQKSQVRVEKNQAIATAKERIDFTPKETQIRLLRQGINSRPFWIVSLSIPGKQENTFLKLALVKIDANTGKVDSVRTQR